MLVHGDVGQRERERERERGREREREREMFGDTWCYLLIRIGPLVGFKPWIFLSNCRRLNH